MKEKLKKQEVKEAIIKAVKELDGALKDVPIDRVINQAFSYAGQNTIPKVWDNGLDASIGKTELNWIFNLITACLMEQQRQGILEWNKMVTYGDGCTSFVIDDGRIFLSKKKIVGNKDNKAPHVDTANWAEFKSGEGKVKKIIAGAYIDVNPSSGEGEVTVKVKTEGEKDIANKEFVKDYAVSKNSDIEAGQGSVITFDKKGLIKAAGKAGLGDLKSEVNMKIEGRLKPEHHKDQTLLVGYAPVVTDLPVTLGRGFFVSDGDADERKNSLIHTNAQGLFPSKVIPKAHRSTTKFFYMDAQWYNHWVTEEEKDRPEVHDIAIVDNGAEKEFFLCIKDYEADIIDVDKIDEYWSDYPFSIGVIEVNGHTEHVIILTLDDIEEGTKNKDHKYFKEADQKNLADVVKEKNNATKIQGKAVDAPKKKGDIYQYDGTKFVPVSAFIITNE